MRKCRLILSYLCLVSIVCFHQTGYTSDNNINITSKTNTTDSTTAIILASGKTIPVDISWKFEVRTKLDANGVEVPETDISVVANSDTIKVGKYVGFPKEVRNIAKARMPKDAILACKTWFGGAGADIYIVKRNSTTLEVFVRQVDEADLDLGKFQKTKEINFPGSIEVRVLKQR